MGIDQTIGKFKNSTTGIEGRSAIYQSILPMIRDYPYFGIGWGNFRHLYPRYAPKENPNIATINYAHSDWLETTTEMGIIGLGLIILAYMLYLKRLIKTWRNRRDLYPIGIGSGVTVALISLGIHSFVDFNMHIPANSLTLATIAGIGYSVVHNQDHGNREKFLYRVVNYKSSPFTRTAFASFILIIFVVSALGSLRHFSAEIAHSTEWNSTLNLNRNPFLSESKTAISRNSENAAYHWGLAWHYIRANTKDPEQRREYNESAIKSLEQAVRRNPAQGSYWYHLGKRYSFKSYDPYDYMKKWLPLAEECFDMAIMSAPVNSSILFNVAWYWVWRSNTLAKKDIIPETNIPQKGKNREEGIKNFQMLFLRALEINPRRWKQAVDRVWEYYPDDAVVLEIGN